MTLDSTTTLLTEEADFVLARRIQRPADKTYRCGLEFNDPFFIIVHQEALTQKGLLNNPRKVERVKKEIEEIKSRYRYILSGPFNIDPVTPRRSPILVCGCFGDACVGELYDRLSYEGYYAFISTKGVLYLLDHMENSGE